MILLKNRFIALVLFLFVMAALPLSVVRCDRDDSSAGTRDSASPPSTAPVTQTLAAEQPDNQKKPSVTPPLSVGRIFAMKRSERRLFWQIQTVILGMRTALILLKN